MRKPPSFKPRICSMCEKEFIPSGSMQKYCTTCSAIADAARKRNFYIKTNPNAYKKRELKVCSVCGKPFSASFNGIPYCNKHFLRMYTTGHTDLQPRKSKNEYRIDGSVAILKTTSGIEFKVDADKLSICQKHTWCMDPRGYLVATSKSKRLVLHRFLTEVQDPSIEVDHINGNKLDNRIENLRKCQHLENGKNLKKKKNNTSGYPGIDKLPTDKYRARIMVEGKEINLGHYASFLEAKRARIAAELKYFGDYAPSVSRT